MRTVRVGVVGVGALGRHHTRLYQQCDGVELVGVYDANRDTACRIGAEFGVEVFETADALGSRVDGLSVAVPTDLHHSVVKALLEEGKHVLVEKPIAQTVREARELVELARQKQLVLQVGHVERFNPVLECLERAPGPPRFIEGHRLATYPPPRPGLRPRGTEVSVVLDLMIHDIDIVLSLVDSEIERLDAVGVPVLSRTEDIANAHIVFKNGCIANLTASRVSQEQLRKIRVFKGAGYLSLDYGAHTGELATRSPQGIERGPVPVHDVNALEAELEDFCRCIRAVLDTGELATPRVSGEEGLRALAVAERILQDIARRSGATGSESVDERSER